MSENDIQINSLLASALDAHQKDHLIEAADLYAKILRISPNHPDANHLSGLIAFQSKNFVEAKSLASSFNRFHSPSLIRRLSHGRRTQTGKQLKFINNIEIRI